MHPPKAAFVSRAISTWRARGMAFVTAAVLVLAAQAAPSASIAQATASAPSLTAASSTQQHDRWMADMAGHIGTVRLGQVILPGSHDSATYGFTNGWVLGAVPLGYATNQDIDVHAQLQHGIRVLDLRGRHTSGTWNRLGLETKQLPQDYYIYHGPDTTDVPLAVVLDDVARWVLAPGHEKEVVIVQVSTDPSGPTPRKAELCGTFKQKLGDVLLTPGTFGDVMAAAGAEQARIIANNANPLAPRLPVPPLPDFPNLGNDLSRYTLNEVWSLPGRQRVILNWPGCVDTWPPHTSNAYWANQCYANSYGQFGDDRPGIIGALQPALDRRLSSLDSDGVDDGLGKIPTRPSTMPSGSPAWNLARTGGTIGPGTYWIGYAWLSPAGETRVGRRARIEVPVGSTTSSITLTLPTRPPGATGAAIYMSQDLSQVAYAGEAVQALGVPDTVLTKQGETDSNEYKLTTRPTTTGQRPTTSEQVGFARDQWGRAVPMGFYTLGIHGTITPDCGFPMDWFLPQQDQVLDTVKSWFDRNENHAREHLNILSADFVQRSKLMEYVLQMNTRSQD